MLWRKSECCKAIQNTIKLTQFAVTLSSTITTNMQMYKNNAIKLEHDYIQMQVKYIVSYLAFSLTLLELHVKIPEAVATDFHRI